MKKNVMFGFIFIFVLFGMSGVFAGACDLDVSLINQDPYPAIQGDYVKLVFQIDGLAEVECGTVRFRLVEKYPISFDSGQEQIYTVEAGTFSRDYASFFLAPFKVRVSEDALNGDNPIEVEYRYGANTGYLKSQFNLNVEDTRAEFEIHVKDYDLLTKTLTFEILNIAEVDVKALTIEIPEQENVVIKGSNINIVGDLDSNEYTTADFEATPVDGELKLEVFYTDINNVRRNIQKTVPFKMSYFQGRAGDANGNSSTTLIIALVVVVIVGYLYYRKRKKKKLLAQKHRHQHRH